MKAHTNHQIIEHNGEPVAVVVPYAEYMNLLNQEAEQDYSVPHEVIEYRLVNEYTSIKAWRLYRGFSQKEMAEKMGSSQSNYSQLESRPFYKAQSSTQRKLCEILGVEPAMMTDFEDITL